MNSPAVYHIILVRKTVVLVYQEHAAQLKDNIFILSAMCKVIVLYVATSLSDGSFFTQSSSFLVILSFLACCVLWERMYSHSFPSPCLDSGVVTCRCYCFGDFSTELRGDQYKDKDFSKKPPLWSAYLGCKDFVQIWLGAGQAYL